MAIVAGRSTSSSSRCGKARLAAIARRKTKGRKGAKSKGSAPETETAQSDDTAPSAGPLAGLAGLFRRRTTVDGVIEVPPSTTDDEPSGARGPEDGRREVTEEARQAERGRQGETLLASSAPSRRRCSSRASAGVVLFAVSIFSIIRIETDPGASATTELTREIPWASWYGIFIFFGSMLLLQLVRVWLHRYRGEDGTPRRKAAADARPEAGALYSEDTPEQAPPGRDSA